MRYQVVFKYKQGITIIVHTTTTVPVNINDCCFSLLSACEEYVRGATLRNAHSRKGVLTPTLWFSCKEGNLDHITINSIFSYFKHFVHLLTDRAGVLKDAMC